MTDTNAEGVNQEPTRGREHTYSPFPSLEAKRERIERAGENLDLDKEQARIDRARAYFEAKQDALYHQEPEPIKGTTIREIIGSLPVIPRTLLVSALLVMVFTIISLVFRFLGDILGVVERGI